MDSSRLHVCDSTFWSACMCGLSRVFRVSARTRGDIALGLKQREQEMKENATHSQGKVNPVSPPLPWTLNTTCPPLTPPPSLHAQRPHLMASPERIVFSSIALFSETASFANRCRR